MVSSVVGSRERWELYIVTDGVMVGILLGEGAYIGFFKSLLAQHVSDVTASIVRSTTVVFRAIGFCVGDRSI
jgi:hypothetical protein